MVKTHAMRAVSELRRQIFSGELAGGQRLFEVPLADAAELDELRRTLEVLDGCFAGERGDIAFERYGEANVRFHAQFVALARSRVIEREIERIYRLPFAAPSAILPDKDYFVSRRRSLDLAQFQHRAIVEAIAAREGTRAEHLAREHARTARGDVEEVLRLRDLPAVASGVAP